MFKTSRIAALAATIGIAGSSLVVAAPAEANPLAILRILMGLGARSALRSSIPKRPVSRISSQMWKARASTRAAAVVTRQVAWAENNAASAGIPIGPAVETVRLGEPTIPALGSDAYPNLTHSDPFVAEALH